MIYMWYARVVCCDPPPTKWQCSRGVDLLTTSEYRINKHLIRSKYKRQATAGVQVQTLNALYREHVIVCKQSHLLSF